MVFFVSIIVIFAISFLMALRSLREELKRLDNKKNKGYELKHGIEIFIERNF